MKLLWARVVAVGLAGALAGAAPAAAAAATPALNLGVIDVVALPDPAHVGLYGYAAGSVAFTAGRLSVIPSIGWEGSSAGAWGFVGAVVLDVAVGPVLGLDAAVTFIHDQVGADWENALFLLGGGLGVTLLVDGLAVSPSVNVFRGLNAPVWSLVPALNLAVPL